MLRPATPLTILLTAALGLLIISVISAPLTKSIYLGKAGDTIYGVLGRCTGDKCTKAAIGYDVSADGSATFTLPEATRQTLAKTLILHPVAAAVTLPMLIMAGVSHIHAAAHSARYLLALFIFTLIAFLVTLAATIINIILFIPHIAFGTWLVLAAAIILFLSTIVTFSMRRSMVGRKARRRQIAENAEMSGENYYNRGEDPMKPMVAMSGANSGADGLPVFASYERNHQKDDQLSDERIPLTQVRTAEPSPVTNTSDLANAGPSRAASRDRYGGQPGQVDPYGAQTQAYGPSGRPSRGSMPGYRGGGAPRGGRGGYGIPAQRRDSYGRGGMGPRGRGSPYGQSRDGYGGPAMAGAAVAGGAMAGAAMARGGHQGYGRRSPAPGPYDTYGNQPANEQGDYSNWGSQSNLGRTDADLPRAESPPPLPTGAAGSGVGPPTEMATTPSAHHGYGAPPTSTTLESNNNLGGMVSMQQQGHPTGQIRPGYASDGSKYSTDEYVAPRTAWNQGSGRQSPRGQSPVHAIDRRPVAADYRGPASPLAGGNSTYYEDVEPRYESSGPHASRVGSPPTHMYEDVHAMDGSRSPAGSERSNFTSVSQRGVNPRWNPHQHPMPHNSTRRALQQQRQDVLLDNPDFQIAGSRSGTLKHGNPAGMVPGSAYPAQI